MNETETKPKKNYYKTFFRIAFAALSISLIMDIAHTLEMMRIMHRLHEIKNPCQFLIRKIQPHWLVWLTDQTDPIQWVYTERRNDEFNRD